MAEAAATALLSHFDLEDLSMGGGTVLQTRWEHRKSLDVDLFCKSDVFARVHRESGGEVEKVMIECAGADPDRTWMEYMALYGEIEGIEVTLMPHVFILDEAFDGVLPGSVPVRLQATSEILAKKLRHRLHGASTVEVRDVYDLACAVELAPEALNDARQALSPEQCYEVCALLAQLPKGWSGQTNKPLIKPLLDWDEAELVEVVRSALMNPCPLDPATRPRP
ncbi:MAG: nucleotidyl transferase AbiEii/AbiGii toxin family protein [Gammaproteobacteria bacterium]|nr:nucleotidyl transferase AbiEii/AbiGii toxin family protein [Gammaproteobacteria bacterium]